MLWLLVDSQMSKVHKKAIESNPSNSGLFQSDIDRI